MKLQIYNHLSTFAFVPYSISSQPMWGITGSPCTPLEERANLSPPQSLACIYAACPALIAKWLAILASHVRPPLLGSCPTLLALFSLTLFMTDSSPLRMTMLWESSCIFSQNYPQDGQIQHRRPRARSPNGDHVYISISVYPFRHVISIKLYSSALILNKGYDQGLFSGIVGNEKFLSIVNHSSPGIMGIIVSIYNLGCFSGTIVSFLLSDKLGPRESMWFAMCWIIVPPPISALSNNNNI